MSPRVPNRFDIETGVTGIVTGLHYAAVKDEDISKRATLILAHGAGGPQLSPFMRQFAEGMASRGIDTVTFNFIYMERGRRAPDPKTRLKATYRAAIETTRAAIASAATRLVIGGKSMGGRIASQVAASDDAPLDVHGLIFLGYPLHPPGRPNEDGMRTSRRSPRRCSSCRAAGIRSGQEMSSSRLSTRVRRRACTSSKEAIIP